MVLANVKYTNVQCFFSYQRSTSPCTNQDRELHKGEVLSARGTGRELCVQVVT